MNKHPYTLIQGPPASGKTTTALNQALTTLKQGRSVWWVGLPHQRNNLLKRLTSLQPAILGFSFMTSMGLYYRLLDTNNGLQAPVPGTERIALTGQAILELTGTAPTPGEARLYARAIAEAKRNNLAPADLPDSTPYADKLRAVYSQYENIKQTQDLWDEDDLRNSAHKLLSTTKALNVDADLIIIDGFRTHTSTDHAIFKNLSAHATTLVTTTIPHDEHPATETLVARNAIEHVTHQLQNPITETRFVLRSLKQDLTKQKLEATSLALIAPEREHTFIRTLASEYGIPLTSDAGTPITKTTPGSILHQLITFTATPHPTKLERIPELQELSIRTRQAGLTGLDGLRLTARQLGAETSAALEGWVERLTPPAVDTFEWAQDLIGLLPELSGDVHADDWRIIRNHLSTRAHEAARLGGGEAFRSWWAALLADTNLQSPPKNAVFLGTPNTVSGAQYAKTYLMGAHQGTYSMGETEDHFNPEEARGALPPRLQGHDEHLHAELVTRAPTVIVTCSKGDQNATFMPEPNLVTPFQPVPVLPAGSVTETLGHEPFSPSMELPLQMLPTTVTQLQSFGLCAARYWADKSIPQDDTRPWWRNLIHDLRVLGNLTSDTLDDVASKYPEATDWFKEYGEHFLTLDFGATVMPPDTDGVYSMLDAVRQGDDGTATIIRFTDPAWVGEQKEAQRLLADRRNEMYAAYSYGEHGAKSIQTVLWPVLGSPIVAHEQLNPSGLPASRAREIEDAFKTLPAAPKVTPTPGFHCRTCKYASVCRKANFT